MRTAVLVMMVLVAGARVALGQIYCPNLDGQEVGIGEGRWRINAGSPATYDRVANAYHDGTDELALGQNYPLGWLDDFEVATFGVSAYLEDISSTACAVGYVRLHMYSRSGTCSAGTDRLFVEYKVSTCSDAAGVCAPDESCFYYGSKFLTKTWPDSYGNAYYQVTAGTEHGITASDTGCFNIGSSASACF